VESNLSIYFWKIFRLRPLGAVGNDSWWPTSTTGYGIRWVFTKSCAVSWSTFRILFIGGTSSVRQIKPSLKPQHPKWQRSTSAAKAYIATTNIPSSPKITCQLCKQTHSIGKCSLFKDQGPNEQFQTVKTLQLCINCLGSGHSVGSCPSKHTCYSSKKQHHSLLHFPADTPTGTSGPPPTSMLVAAQKPQSVLLSTLLVSVLSVDYLRHTLRAFVGYGRTGQLHYEAKRRSPIINPPSLINIQHKSAFSDASVNKVSGVTSIVISPVVKPDPSV